MCRKSVTLSHLCECILVVSRSGQWVSKSVTLSHLCECILVVGVASGSVSLLHSLLCVSVYW